MPTGTWSADRIHSTVGFAVPYMAGTFQGTFSDFEAQLSDDALSGTAKVASVEVKDPNLAAHLQSPAFFDAERFPQLSFKADDVGRSGDDLTISGELTLKGHTEPVEIKRHISDPAPDPYGGEFELFDGLKAIPPYDEDDDGGTARPPSSPSSRRSPLPTPCSSPRRSTTPRFRGC